MVSKTISILCALILMTLCLCSCSEVPSTEHDHPSAHNNHENELNTATNQNILDLDQYKVNKELKYLERGYSNLLSLGVDMRSIINNGDIDSYIQKHPMGEDINDHERGLIEQLFKDVQELGKLGEIVVSSHDYFQGFIYYNEYGEEISDDEYYKKRGAILHDILNTNKRYQDLDDQKADILSKIVDDENESVMFSRLASVSDIEKEMDEIEKSVDKEVDDFLPPPVESIIKSYSIAICFIDRPYNALAIIFDKIDNLFFLSDDIPKFEYYGDI